MVWPGARPATSFAAMYTFAGDIMSMSTEVDEDASREPAGEVQGHIHFEDVSFEYDPGVPVLAGHPHRPVRRVAR